MTKTNYFIIIFFLTLPFNSVGQNNCGITVDTSKILLDENLDSFLSYLQTESFQTYSDKKKLPVFIKQQLNCLTKDKFSLANPNEKYRCCCTSSDKLPRRKLLFFSTSQDVFLITYLTGGIGVSTNILMFKFQGDKIIDLWTGYGFPEFKSKEEVIKHIKQNRKKEFGLHSNFISL
jgi:Fe-S cluster assembly iron-binding protein IscA